MAIHAVYIEQDFEEDLTGQIDGVKNIFTLSNIIIPGSLKIYLNGNKLIKGNIIDGKDFIEVDGVIDVTEGGIATASSNRFEYEVWRLFQDGAPNAWSSGDISAPWWVAYEFGGGNSKVIVKYALEKSGVNGYPIAWNFEGWNGSSWDVLDTRSGSPALGLNNPFTFVNTTAYTKYRLYMTENDGQLFVGLNALEMYLAPEEIFTVQINGDIVEVGEQLNVEYKV